MQALGTANHQRRHWPTIGFPIAGIHRLTYLPKQSLTVKTSNACIGRFLSHLMQALADCKVIEYMDCFAMQS